MGALLRIKECPCTFSYAYAPTHLVMRYAISVVKTFKGPKISVTET